MRGMRAQRELNLRDDSAVIAVSSQLTFEAIAHEEWTETCLFERSEVRRCRLLHLVWGPWQWSARCTRSRFKVNPRNFNRALTVVEKSIVLANATRAHLAFVAWQGFASQARCRWLRKRCRRIRAVLGQQSDSARSTPRVPNKPTKTSLARLKSQENIGSTTISPNLAYRDTSGRAAQSASSASAPLLSSDDGRKYVKATAPSSAASPAMDDDAFAAKLKGFTFGVG